MVLVYKWMVGSNDKRLNVIPLSFATRKEVIDKMMDWYQAQDSGNFRVPKGRWKI